MIVPLLLTAPKTVKFALTSSTDVPSTNVKLVRAGTDIAAETSTEAPDAIDFAATPDPLAFESNNVAY